MSMRAATVVQHCASFAGLVLCFIACFWPPDFFGGGPPEFLDLDYKTQTVSDHVAKFHGDRLRDLGERIAKE